MDWDELGNRLAMFGDNDSVRTHSVEQRQALFFKFSSWDCFHEKTILRGAATFPVRKNGHNSRIGVKDIQRLAVERHDLAVGQRQS